MVFKKTQEHLHESGMTYFYHCRHGIINGSKMILGGLTSYIHSFFPFIFKKHSLLTVIKLYNEVSRRKHVKKIIAELKQV